MKVSRSKSLNFDSYAVSKRMLKEYLNSYFLSEWHTMIAFINGLEFLENKKKGW